MQKNRAFFLDRDGVIIKNIPYLNSTQKVEFLDGISDAIKIINTHGYKCIVITNQSGIARGLISIDQLSSIHEHIQRYLAEKNAKIDCFYFCPHLPEGKIPMYSISCQCRKPKAGMLYAAAKDHDIDLSSSFMIGDSSIDFEAGQRAGCTSIILNRNARLKNGTRIFASLYEVVDWIINSQDRIDLN